MYDIKPLQNLRNLVKLTLKSNQINAITAIQSLVSLQILKKIPFDKYKFATITFEHDDYSDIDDYVKKESRNYLESQGYILVVNDVSNDGLCAYEDWWVHPDLVNMELVEKIINNSKPINSISKIMFQD